ncbi:hypothetical protein Taro_054292 [Colocasia esculenta]|uniref:Uncharacterized protein n=1 Tax=Colocasia esculenta TaxID=4460 RepID=A0A843XQN0_COLES|nr:hypothetical protein [Colocasia esculenta]
MLCLFERSGVRMRSHRQPATALSEFGRRTENLRMRPFTDRVDVTTLNWGLTGGSDLRANKYPRPTRGYGSRCTITHAPGGILAPERNSAKLAPCRPSRSADSKLWSHKRFRCPCGKLCPIR